MDTLPLDLDALRADSDGADALPAETDVGHVHLEVTDIDAARTFYVDAVGLGIRQEWEGAAFVAAGDYHHHVGLNAWNGRSEPATGRGLDWFELVVPAESLADVRERLTDSGLAVRDTDGGFAVDDPDGIGLRFSSP
jgi:catechol 2,3-dioxygenase